MQEKDSNIKKKYTYLAKNTAIFAVSTFATKLLSFLLLPLYTGILSTSDYGVADIISTSTMLMCYVFTINIADSVVRFGIDAKENKEGILLYALKVVGVGSIFAGLFVICFALINPFKWENYCFIFLFAIYVFHAFNDVTDKYLRAIEKIKEVAIASIILTASTILSNIVCLVFLKIGLKGYLFSFAFSFFVSTLYKALVIISTVTPSELRICNRDTQKAMRLFCIPLIFNGVIWWLNGSLDRFFLLEICGSSSNGLYAVASKIPTILTVCASIFQQAWHLSAVRGYDKEDKDGFFATTYSTYNALLVLASSGIILFNIPIARILFSKDFFEAWQYSSVLVVSGLFSSMSGFTGTVFSAAKNTKIYMSSSLLSLFVNIALNAILIPKIGIQGATIATAASFFAIWAIRFIMSRKYIKWKINIINNLVCYILLIVQIILEHTNNHMYLLQVAVFVLLLVLNRQYVKKIIEVIIHYISKAIRKLPN